MAPARTEAPRQTRLAKVVYDADLAQQIVDDAAAAKFSKTITEPFIVWLITHCGLSAEAKLLGMWHLAAAGEKGHTLSHRQVGRRLSRIRTGTAAADMKYQTVRRLTYECVRAGIIERTNRAGGRALTTPGVWASNLLNLTSDPAHATGRGVPTPRAGSVGSRSSPTSPQPPNVRERVADGPKRIGEIPLLPTAAAKRRFTKSDFVASDVDCPRCGQDTVLRNVITSELNPLCGSCYRTVKASGEGVDAWRRGQRPAPPDPAQNDHLTATPHGLVYDKFAHERGPDPCSTRAISDSCCGRRRTRPSAPPAPPLPRTRGTGPGPRSRSAP